MPEQEVSDEPTGARPFWSGNISFGLVSVPVQLYPAYRKDAIHFRMLGPHGVPVRRQYVCSKEQKPVPREHLVRGFEVEEGRHVVITEEELEKLAPKESREIELKSFLTLAQLDRARLDRPFFLMPAGGSTKAYRLLAHVMEKTGRAALATFVLRGKEHLVAILAEDGILRAEILRFTEELRPVDEVGLPRAQLARSDPKLVGAFERAIRSLSTSKVTPEDLEDPYVKGVRTLVERKRRKGEDVIEAPQVPDEDGDEPVDLVEILKRSMQAGSKARPAARRGERAAATRRGTARRKTASR